MNKTFLDQSHYVAVYGALLLFFWAMMNNNQSLNKTLILGYLVFIASDKLYHYAIKKYFKVTI